MMKPKPCVNMAAMQGAARTPDPQSASAVLMVRPARFGFNPETAASNAFQRSPAGSGDPGPRVLQEFEALTAALEAAGIEVLIADDTASPVKPDAIFPNNWVSFHHDGTVILYPMLAPNRRLERRAEILQQVARAGFEVSRTLDLSHRETAGRFLEGTGSMVLDRVRKIAYACNSPRTDPDVLREFAREMGYELLSFDAVDAAGKPVYHTNVMMAIGSGFAVLCVEAIPSARERAAVQESLRAGGLDIVEISRAQMQSFAGNVLELAAPAGRLLALSTTALSSLLPAQRELLDSHARVLPVAIPHVERYGGGGVRCMLAEIHLPKRRMS